MSTPQFSTLPTNLQQHFWDLVNRWKLEPGDVGPDVNTAEIAPETLISRDPETTHVKTKPFNFADVQKMKEMVGVPDDQFDAGLQSDRAIHYPDTLPQRAFQLFRAAPNNCTLKSSLSAADHATIQQAWQAYVTGDSRKVAPAMVELINAVNFPMTVGVTAAQNITIASGQTLTLGSSDGSSQTVIFGTLQIQAGGVLKFSSPVNLQGAMSIVASDGKTASIQIVGTKPATPPTPGTPGPVGSVANAVPGTRTNQGSDKNPNWVCSPAPTAASTGLTGNAGGPGGAGTNATSPPPVVAVIAVGTGTYTFSAAGVSGGDGGVGATGGTGGTGGNGCTGTSPCSPQNPGQGGQGGTGGTGGMPGNAAPGSTSKFTFTNIQSPFTYSIQTPGGTGGNAGAGGTGGQPGSGGNDLGSTMGGSYVPAQYNRGKGPDGPKGNGGNPGANAPGGQVIINVGPPVS